MEFSQATRSRVVKKLMGTTMRSILKLENVLMKHYAPTVCLPLKEVNPKT